MHIINSNYKFMFMLSIEGGFYLLQLILELVN
jgi:hypothetical protein